MGFAGASIWGKNQLTHSLEVNLQFKNWGKRVCFLVIHIPLFFFKFNLKNSRPTGALNGPGNCWFFCFLTYSDYHLMQLKQDIFQLKYALILYGILMTIRFLELPNSKCIILWLPERCSVLIEVNKVLFIWKLFLFSLRSDCQRGFLMSLGTI